MSVGIREVIIVVKKNLNILKITNIIVINVFFI